MDAVFPAAGRTPAAAPSDAEADAGWPAPVVVRRPDRPAPVVFASPHSGRHYPSAMMERSQLDAREIRLSEDALVDELIAPAIDAGATLILAGHARAWVDVNRAAEELDAAMFDAPPEGLSTVRTPRVAAGLGAIPRTVGAGREIYGSKLPAEEARSRIERTWRPYHAALEDALEDARRRFGRVVLVDWHSMPSAAAATAPGRAPDMVLGDRFGASCSGALSALVQRELEATGYRVARNAPYSGGWTTERYGRPEAGKHALQIEISRRLYMDETALRRHDGFERLKRDLTRVGAAVAALAPRL